MTKLQKTIKIFYRGHKQYIFLFSFFVILFFIIIYNLYPQLIKLTKPYLTTNFFKEKQAQIEYYPIPKAQTTISTSSVPVVEGVPVGQRPEGFPNDLPLYKAEKIIQAYRSFQSGSSSLHTAMIFTTKAQPKEVLEFYKNFLEEKNWITEFQPVKKPQALYAKQDKHSILISTMAYQEGYLINVSYAER